MNIADTIDDARRAYERAGRGCLVRHGEDIPCYATVAEIAGRLEPHPDATMLLTAVSEAVERYGPSREPNARCRVDAVEMLSLDLREDQNERARRKWRL